MKPSRQVLTGAPPCLPGLVRVSRKHVGAVALVELPVPTAVPYRL